MARARSQISILDALEIYRCPEPLMAIFQAFFDESGKFKDKHVVSLCGLCSPLPRVREFEEDWKGLLRHYNLPCLTMKRALRRKIPFSSNTQAKSAEERNNVLQPFAHCIRKHFELGVATIVDVDAYKQWPAHAKRIAGGSDNPYYFAFLYALLAPAKYVRGEDRISLVLDDDKETAINSYRLYSRAKTAHSGLRQKIVSITFADDNEFVPLQAADLLASLFRLEAGRLFHRDYYEYVKLFNALTRPDSNGGMTWAVSFYDSEQLNSLGDQLRRTR